MKRLSCAADHLYMSPIVTVTPARSSLHAVLGVIIEAQRDPATAGTIWPAPSDIDSITSWMTRLPGDLWLIRVDGEPCGALYIHPVDTGHESRRSADLYLVPDARDGHVGAIASTQVLTEYPSGTLLATSTVNGSAA